MLTVNMFSCRFAFVLYFSLSLTSAFSISLYFFLSLSFFLALFCTSLFLSACIFSSLPVSAVPPFACLYVFSLSLLSVSLPLLISVSTPHTYTRPFIWSLHFTMSEEGQWLPVKDPPRSTLRQHNVTFDTTTVGADVLAFRSVTFEKRLPL